MRGIAWGTFFFAVRTGLHPGPGHRCGHAGPARLCQVVRHLVRNGFAGHRFAVRRHRTLLVPTGFMIDRFGRRKVIIAGPILSAVSSVLTATAGSFPELLFWRFLNGWATGMWTMGRITMMSGRRRRLHEVGRSRPSSVSTTPVDWSARLWEVFGSHLGRANSLLRSRISSHCSPSYPV